MGRATVFLAPVLVFLVFRAGASGTRQEDSKFSSFDLVIPENGTGLAKEDAVGNGTAKAPRTDLVSLLNAYDVSAIRRVWQKESGRLSDGCRRDTNTFLTALEDSQLWALKVYRHKLRSGVHSGRYVNATEEKMSFRKFSTTVHSYSADDA
ncbi:UNVERIFIED_CONTAM: hypothetical protein PYX00_003880 [Menopon gallinae]|uniref:Uncharacterized protein n=1 Tax=Menopon gallinae TaxID=328185 RepID=A0AAW2I3I0_9NEOP